MVSMRHPPAPRHREGLGTIPHGTKLTLLPRSGNNAPASTDLVAPVLSAKPPRADQVTSEPQGTSAPQPAAPSVARVLQQENTRVASAVAQQCGQLPAPNHLTVVNMNSIFANASINQNSNNNNNNNSNTGLFPNFPKFPPPVRGQYSVPPQQLHYQPLKRGTMDNTLDPRQPKRICVNNGVSKNNEVGRIGQSAHPISHGNSGSNILGRFPTGPNAGNVLANNGNLPVGNINRPVGPIPLFRAPLVNGPTPQDSPIAPAASNNSDDESAETGPEPDETSDPSNYFQGTTLLAIPGEEDNLSPLHCFVRSHCVEAFTAEESDVSIPRYGRAKEKMVDIGQVGIRCMFCKHIPLVERTERSQSFPMKIDTIYYAVETWLRKHKSQCCSMPEDVRKKIDGLLELARTTAGGRRQFWIHAANQIGLVNTAKGLRFGRTPGFQSAPPEAANSAFGGGPAEGTHFQPDDEPGYALVADDDRDLVSPYVFQLLSQMESCKFSVEDRDGGRSNINKDCPVGYPGYRCKHCKGSNGIGRYFPSSVQALALPNCDRNIYNHLQKCRRCPPHVLEQVELMKPTAKTGRKGRGTRKMFFRRIWNRLHNPGGDVDVDPDLRNYQFAVGIRSPWQHEHGSPFDDPV